MIPPPPVREGRALSRCSGAAAHTEDLPWKKHSVQTAAETQCSFSVIHSALWLKIVLFLQVNMCLFLFFAESNIIIHSIRRLLWMLQVISQVNLRLTRAIVDLLCYELRHIGDF